MTLTEFLTARIDEDEEMANFGAYGPSPDRAGWTRYSPAAMRMLAECEAKRRIVDRYAYLYTHGDSGDMRWVLPLLALPYADHPDYRPEWRP